MCAIAASWAEQLGKFLAFTGLLCISVLAQAASEDDPWESFNRPIFTFNDTLDTYALKPLAQGYQAITPQFLEDGIHNMFANVGDVGNLANNLLQGKLEAAGIDTSRVLFNTTFGLLGFFDVASKMELRKSDEDFGQTLGVWGVGSGPYVVLPLLGPSSGRDAVAKIPDSLLEPYPYINDVPARNLIHGVEVVENPDVDSLRAAVQSVYDAYPQYADYIARIQALLAE